MNKQLAALLFAAFASFTTIAQIAVESSSKVDTAQSSTQGVFLNKGTLKVTSLECYNFSSMLVAFNIKDEFYSYDIIQIIVEVDGSGDRKFNSYDGIDFSQEEFSRNFAGKEYGYVDVFTTEALKDRSKNFGFTRGEMEFEQALFYSPEKTLHVYVVGRDIVDVKTTYKTTSNGEVEAVHENIEKATTLTHFSIKLTNIKKYWYIPIIGQFFPKNPTENGDCYKE